MRSIQRCLPKHESVETVVREPGTPFSQPVRNYHSLHPPVALVLTETRKRGEGYGFDVLSGQFVRMNTQGTVYSLATTRGALEAAASAAIMAMTTNTIILQ